MAKRPDLAARNFIHGEAVRGNVSPEVKTLNGMIQRCTNPKNNSYRFYGARGITVWEEWQRSPATFVEHVGRKPSPRHTIDRYPNKDGNYEPGNVRWLLKPLQQRNRRDNITLTIDGETRCIAEWAEVAGVVGKNTIYYRHKSGWDDRSAVFTPPLKLRRKQTF